MKPSLKLVESTESIDIRVCNIVFRSDPEHEFRAVQAIRNRRHPAWSRSFSDFRVSQRRKLKTVSA
jgi:hypothetical protein